MKIFIPSWTGEKPENATFNYHVDEKFTEIIRRISEDHFNIQNAIVLGKLNKSEQLLGHYLVKSSSNDRFVLHVKELTGGTELSFADKITQQCEMHGVKTNKYTYNRNGEIELDIFGTYINCTSYVDGNHLPLNSKTARTLGQELSKLHFALRQNSALARKVVKASHERRNQMQQIIERLKSRFPNLNGPHSDILKESLENYRFRYGYQAAQICHGDLNPGNLIYTKDSDICFIDFNDTLFSWYDPIFDVATCYLRYCWEDKRIGNELSDAFLNAYSNSQMTTYSTESVKKAARNMVYQNIIIISSGNDNNHRASELSKFDKLLSTTWELDG